MLTLLPPILFGGSGGSSGDPMTEPQLRSVIGMGQPWNLMANVSRTTLSAQETLRPLLHLFAGEPAAPMVPFRTPTAPATFSTTRPTFTGTDYVVTGSTDFANKLALCATGGSIVGGDRILIPPGMTVTGYFVLPTRSAASGIIEITTQISQATLDAMCPPGKRMTPAIAAALNLATINAQFNNGALVTDWAAKGYRVTAVIIGGDPALAGSSGAFLRFGRLDFWQDAQACSDNIADRIYVKGSTDTTKAWLRGVSLSGPRTALIDSWVEDFYSGWTTGSDAQPVAVFEYMGPYIIRNCYLDGLGEGFLCGGQHWSHPGNGGLVSATAGFATFSASQAAYLVNGMGILIDKHRYVVSAFDGTTHCTLTTTTGGPLTFTNFGFSIADPANPNAVPSDLTFTDNYVTRKGSIVGRRNGIGTIACTAGAAVLSSGANGLQQNNNVIVAGTRYLVSAIIDATHCTLAGSPTFGASSFIIEPTSVGKNGFELKSVRRAFIARNIIENVSSEAQYGFLMNVKSVGNFGYSEDGTSDVEFYQNWLRYGAGGVQFTAIADDNPEEIAKHTKRIYFHETLVERVNDTTPWVENPTDPNSGGRTLHFLGDLADVTVEHCTFVKLVNTGQAGILLDSEDPTATPPHLLAYASGPLAVVNNIVQRGFYGLSSSGIGEGSPAWNRYTAGYGFWQQNVVSGLSSPTGYPAGTYAAANDAAIGFFDLSGGGAGYQLNPATSAYDGLATDGGDIGIRDVPAFMAALAHVISGDPGSGGGTGDPMTEPQLRSVIGMGQPWNLMANVSRSSLGAQETLRPLLHLFAGEPVGPTGGPMTTLLLLMS